MNISFGVMAHGDRANHANDLLNKLLDMPFYTGFLSFDKNNSEWDNGKVCLENFSTLCDYHVVIQDDAIIGPNFYTNLEASLKALPQKSILSLYYGQGRPYPQKVKQAFDKAIETDSSFISHRTLLWAVCIAIPTEDIEPMLQHAKRYPKLQYDNRIGQFYKDRKRPVYYTTKSIADHNDDLPSLTGHDTPRKRVAHCYTDEVLEFNGKVVQI